MPAHLLVEEARPTEGGRLQLHARIDLALKRRLVLLAANESVPLGHVVNRALAREVMRHPEAAGLTSPDPDPTTEEGPSVS